MNKFLRPFVRRFSQCSCNRPVPNCSPPPKSDVSPPCRRPPSDSIVGSSGYVDGGYKKYRNIVLFICLPTICALSVVMLNQPEVERPEFHAYEHMRKRNKLFPWDGGSNKTFFHNPRVNALPDGYED
ncbi:hypothetical protein FQA39_LY00156 [Lamprigera yunnana]|nr:hypothetical protein FQA39_LY00156 [Lamprigera yunnana]